MPFNPGLTLIHNAVGRFPRSPLVEQVNVFIIFFCLLNAISFRDLASDLPLSLPFFFPTKLQLKRSTAHKTELRGVFLDPHKEGFIFLYHRLFTFFLGSTTGIAP